MRARDLSFWRQKAAEYSLSAAKQCSAVKYNSFWPYGHTMVLCCMVHSVPCSAKALCMHRNLCYVGLAQQCIPTKNCTYIVARTV